MNFCTLEVQEALKSLITSEGNYLFMNAEDGSTHPSSTRMMLDLLSLEKQPQQQPQSRKRKRTRQPQQQPQSRKRKKTELVVKDDVKKVISELQNLSLQDKENLNQFFTKLIDWLEQLDFIKERNLKRENILMVLVQSLGSENLLDFFQGNHTDFQRSGINKVIKDNKKDKKSSTMNMPLGALLCIDSVTDSFLRIIPNSHKYNRNPNKHVFHKPQVIRLQRGEIIFFHALLAHAGYGNEKNHNVRLHFYLVKEYIMNLITLGGNDNILGTFPFDEYLKKETTKNKSKK